MLALSVLRRGAPRSIRASLASLSRGEAPNINQPLDGLAADACMIRQGRSCVFSELLLFANSPRNCETNWARHPCVQLGLERHRSSSTQPTLCLPRRPPPRRSRHAAQARAPTPDLPDHSLHTHPRRPEPPSPPRRRDLGARTAACLRASRPPPVPLAAVLVSCGAPLSPAGLARCGAG